MKLKQCTGACQLNLTTDNSRYEGVQKSKKRDLYLFTCDTCRSTIAIRVEERPDLTLFLVLTGAEYSTEISILRKKIEP